ncbi:MAG TPA: hypothetical protein VGF99_00970 [Myxococcota bacterium]
MTSVLFPQLDIAMAPLRQHLTDLRTQDARHRSTGGVHGRRRDDGVDVVDLVSSRVWITPRMVGAQDVQGGAP